MNASENTVVGALIELASEHLQPAGSLGQAAGGRGGC